MYLVITVLGILYLCNVKVGMSLAICAIVTDVLSIIGNIIAKYYE